MKPFFFKKFIRNFNGTRARRTNWGVPYDRRTDWTSNLYTETDFTQGLTAYNNQSFYGPAVEEQSYDFYDNQSFFNPVSVTSPLEQTPFDNVSLFGDAVEEMPQLSFNDLDVYGEVYVARSLPQTSFDNTHLFGTVVEELVKTSFDNTNLFGAVVEELVKTPFDNQNIWEPTDLGAKLLGWWDPSDPSTVTLDGSNFVVGIDNKDGTGLDITGNPGFVVGSFNGLDTVRAAEQWLTWGLTSKSALDNAVGLYSFKSTSDTPWILARGSATSRYFGAVASGLFIAPDNTFSGLTYWANGVAEVSPTRDDLYNAWDGAGIVGVTDINGLDFNQDAYFYNFTTSGNNFTGDFGDIVLVQTALTTQEREELEGYLAQKWGVSTNLPVTHPYHTPRVNQSDFGAVVVDKGFELTAFDNTSLYGDVVVQVPELYSSVSGNLGSGDYYNDILLGQPNITSGDVVAHYSFQGAALTDDGPNSYNADAISGTDFPSIVGTGATATNASGVVWMIPRHFEVGDLLLCIVGIRGSSPTLTTPEGWESVSNTSDSELGLGIFARIADGTEGPYIDCSPTGGSHYSGISYAVSNFNGTISTDIDVQTASGAGNGDPPSVTAGWGADNNLFIMAVVGDEGSNGSLVEPANYTDSSNASVGSTTTGCTISTAWRKVNAASDDPGSLTYTGGTMSNNRTATVVIRPASTWAPNVTVPLAAQSTGSYLFGRANDVSLGDKTRFNYIHNTATFTISLWVKELPIWGDSVSFFQNEFNFILGSTTTISTDQGFYFAIDDVDELDVFVAGYSVSAGTSREWVYGLTSRDVENGPFHLCLTGDGTNGDLYVNGSSVGSVTISSNTGDATNKVHVGADPTATETGWQGYIDEVSFLDKALTANEVALLYDSGRDALRAQKYQAYYSLDEGPSDNPAIVREADLKLRLVLNQNTYSDAGTTASDVGRPVQEWTATHGSYTFENTTTSDKPTEELYGINFDGTDDYLQTKTAVDAGELDIGTGDVTVLAWIKHDTAETSDLLYFRDNGAGTDGWLCDLDGTTPSVRALCFGGASAYSDTAAYTIGQWSLVGFRIDTAALELEAIGDGALSGTPTTITAVDFGWDTATFSPTIGWTPQIVRGYFDGKIAEIRYYDVALTDAEIYNIAHKGPPRIADYYRNNVGRAADASDVELYLPLTDPQRAPDEILGTKLKHWWDFSDKSTLWQNTGGTVGVWADNQPILRVDDKAGAMNLTEAVSGITWDETTGGADFATASMSGTFPANISAPFSVISVFHPDTTAEQNIHGDTDTSSYLIINYLATSGDHRIYTGTSQAIISSQPTTTRMLTELNTKSGNDEYFVNGVSVYSAGDTGDEAPDLGDSWIIGDDAGVYNKYYDGIFCEQLIVEGAITADERSEVYGYLANKWQIADMGDNSDFYEAEVVDWTPLSLGRKLWAWWDPSDSSTVTLNGSSQIQQIDDKSGRARHLVDSGVEGITITTDTSGLDVVDMGNVATTIYLEYAEGDDVSGIVEMHSYFDSQSDASWIAAASGISGDYVWAAEDADAGAVDSDAGTPAYFIDGTSESPADRNAAHDASIGRHLFGATSLTLGTSWTSFLPFHFRNSGFYYTGYFGDVVLISTALTTDERQKLEGYLAHKYGIEANLDISHPYKSTPPKKGNRFDGVGYFEKGVSPLIETAAIKAPTPADDSALVGDFAGSEFEFLHTTSDWTVAFWLDFIGEPTTGVILDNTGSLTTDGIKIEKGSGDVDFILRANSTNYTLTSVDGNEDGDGRFCVWTNNAGTLSLYVNGEAFGTVAGATSTDINEGPLTLFATSNNLSDTLHGATLSHLTILNRGISLNEANDMYRNAIGLSDSTGIDVGSVDYAVIAGPSIVREIPASKAIGGWHDRDSIPGVTMNLGNSHDWGAWANGQQTFTFGMWVGADRNDTIDYSLASQDYCILTNRLNTNEAGFSLGIRTVSSTEASTYIELYRSNNTSESENHSWEAAILDDNPIHLIYAMDGIERQVQFYLNGVPEDNPDNISAFPDWVASEGSVVHGQEATNDEWFLRATLDEVFATREKINDREAMRLFAEGAPDYIRCLYEKSTLWYRYQLGGTSIIDQSRSAPRLNGTAAGLLRATIAPSVISGDRGAWYTPLAWDVGLSDYYRVPMTSLPDRWLLDNNFTALVVGIFTATVENLLQFTTDSSGYIRFGLANSRFEISDGTNTVNGTNLGLSTSTSYRICYHVDWGNDEVKVWVNGALADTIDITSVNFTGHGHSDSVVRGTQHPQGRYSTFALFVGADDALLTDAERANL